MSESAYAPRFAPIKFLQDLMAVREESIPVNIRHSSEAAPVLLRMVHHPQRGQERGMSHGELREEK